MLQALTDWWDTLELWLAQRSFPLQFVLVMLVLMPVCLGLAWLIDRVAEYVFARLGARGADEDPPRSSS